MQTDTPPQLHTLSVISSRTSLSRSALYREIKAGRLSTVKVGRALRITEAELHRFISALSGETASK
jgi:excisionase family DNA binding protein